METVLLQTSLFGALEFKNQDGLMKDVSILLGGRKLTVTLYLWENFITEQNYADVLTFLEQIPAMYQKAREVIETSHQENEVIRYFIQSQINEIEEQVLLDYFDVETLQQITPERFLQKLEPRTIWIAPTVSPNGEIDCTFDFSIEEEISDELLVISFSPAMEITRIVHES